MALIGTDIDEAALWLTGGGLVAIPTETVYGLAANALDVAAVARVFAAKNRPFFDPLIVHVARLEQALDYAREIPAPLQALAMAFWPGPLTLLLPRRPIIPSLVTAGSELVGLRVPAHPMTQALLGRLAYPLAAPSANPFGYVSPTRAGHVARQLGDRIDYILDGGPCTVGLESTIVSWTGDGLAVHRLGGLTLEQLRAAAPGVDVSLTRPKLDTETTGIQPGSLAAHYAPRVPLRLFQTREQALEALDQDPKAILLGFGALSDQISIDRQVTLSEQEDATEAAGRLFDLLQALDGRGGVSQILAHVLPDEGLGRAINDRLRRAAAAAR